MLSVTNIPLIELKEFNKKCPSEPLQRQTSISLKRIIIKRVNTTIWEPLSLSVQAKKGKEKPFSWSLPSETVNTLSLLQTFKTYLTQIQVSFYTSLKYK